MTMAAQQLMDLSVAEDRIVTEYPDSAAEFADIEIDLLAEDDVDYAEVSGSGYSGPEARGWAEYWGTRDDGSSWRVHLVHAADGE